METNLRRTPLFEEHKKLGARFTGFGGWEMPVQYSGITEEHVAVRTACGLFDVSHMGEVFVEGDSVVTFLQKVTTNDICRLEDGMAQYSMLLNEDGGVVDDIIVYRINSERYLVCVNASNTEKDFAWLKKHEIPGAKLTNASSSYSQVAIQGPEAYKIFAQVLKCSEDELLEDNFPLFTFRIFPDPSNSKLEIIVARTGYTGEDGFEVFISNETVVNLWNSLLSYGEGMIKPCGLGARDTLRLEACLPLHGHELSDTITPLSAGLAWAVKLDKGEFIGKVALLKQRNEAISPVLVCLEVVDAGIVREGAKLFLGEREIGWISSGTKTPTVGKAIAMGFVPAELKQVGTELEADVRGRRLKMKVVKRPFYKRTK